jgi:diguanylate cyclase (GGDEF)-like protein
MKESKIYKYAPAILPVGVLILWLVTFLTDKYAYGYSRGLGCMSFVIIQMIISIICGILIRRLHQQVCTDTLTGLYNRKFFHTRLSELRTKAPVSLILIDIDNFKSINDTYGHIVGDQVLQQFAEILQSNTRTNDIIARWGGEEFAVILPRTYAEEASNIANRIRMIVENHFFSYGNITCKITVSMGIASVRQGTDVGPEQFIKTADEALYKAKEKKNFVVINTRNLTTDA